MKILYFQIIIFLLFSFGCKKTDKSDSSDNTHRKDSDNTSASKNNAINVILSPVSKLNPTVASSTIESKTFNGNRKVNYAPVNLLDFNDNTAWIEGSNKGGAGEWVAIYLGEGGNIKDISEIVVFILTFYRNYNNDEKGESGRDYLRPTKFNLELYVDTTLITSSKDADNNDNEFMPDMPRYLRSDSKNLQSGIIWLKIVILKSEITCKNFDGSKRNNNACIGDVWFNIKNDNPHNIKEAVSKFAKGIKEKNKTIISEFTNKPYKEVLDEFTNEFVPEEGPKCNPKRLRIHSENIAFVFATEGGDGGSWAKFEFKNDKWYFIETIYLTNT
jgi:hypothetical protein